ncbi:MAG: hypothetical protein ACRDHL_15195 [Candidatus Promineifilaceae bacterium]
MTRRALSLVFLSTLGVLVLLAALPVYSGVTGVAPNTWPTKTPTPPGQPSPTNVPLPTATSGGGGGGGGGGDVPTPIPPPPAGNGATATSGAPPPPAGDPPTTPIGGFLPTALPCGESPTLQARSVVNVRFGPNLDYAVIGRLAYLEVRPILARAASAPWWLIEMTGGTAGWVADMAVLVSGRIEAIEVATPPPLGGIEPTPGSDWQPTPNPACPPLPTPTASPNASPPRDTARPATSQPSPQATRTEEPASRTPRPLPSATQPPAASPTAPLPTPAADGGDGARGGLPVMLFAGLGLVAAGAAALVIRRQANGAA